MVVNFVTPTRLSLLDLTTMGDSDKKDDSSKIGSFNSGFKYAIALLLRANVDLKITVVGYDTEYSENGEIDLTYTDNYSFRTDIVECESTGKKKEIIVIDYEKTYGSFKLEGSKDISDTIFTGFAKNLGLDWILPYSWRELHSNCIDENGYFTTDESVIVNKGTVISLYFDDENPFYEVWLNRELYSNFKVPLYSVIAPYYGQFDLLPNEDGYLKIYKQNILVHSDEEVVSKFAYNLHFGELDERRILLDLYSVKSTITTIIKNSNNEDFLRYLISQEFDSEDWLNYNDNYTSEASNLIFDIVHELNPDRTLKWIKDSVTKRKDCKLAGKVINSLEDHVWSAKSKVTIDSTPIIQEEKEITFQDEINKLYKFDIGDVCIKTAQLTGKKVVADKYEKCLILSDDFSLEDNFNDFVTEYFNLTSNENIIKSLSDYIIKLIKK